MDGPTASPVVVTIGSMTDEEYMTHLAELDNVCNTHLDCVLDLRVKKRALRAQVELLESECDHHIIEASKASIAMKHAIRQRADGKAAAQTIRLETPAGGTLKSIGLLIGVGLISLTMGAGMSMAPAPQTAGEMELTELANKRAHAGDYSGLLEISGQLGRAGCPASAAYWEGIALFNLGSKESAAQSFLLAGHYGHPRANGALKAVRSR